MNIKAFVLGCAFAVAAVGQDGYIGPSVLTRGAGDIGNRAGQQMDLRFYGGVNAVYDSGLQPVSVDSKGNLVTLDGLYGVEANFGAYGRHNWRNAVLGLDYNGVYRYYSNNSYAAGIDQMLNLGYTLQKTKRLIISVNVLGGTIANGLGAIATGIPTVTSNQAITPTTLLFDNRTYYGQVGMDVTYRLTPRTSFTVGGDGFIVRYQSDALIGAQGYNLRGSIDHKMSRRTSVGLYYHHDHYDYPHAYGQADIDGLQAYLGTNFGPHWRFTARVGAFRSEVQGLQEVTLDPVVAALLGYNQIVQSFYHENYYPDIHADLARTFKTASLSFYFSTGANAGNGVYLTSRSENAGVTYSYSGIRKTSLFAQLGYSHLSSIGPDYQPYTQATGGLGMTYTILRSLHVIARYDYRYQDITQVGYKHEGYRAMLGISFSPGDIPLSLW